MNMIRTFRNGDVPALAELWIQHWSLLGPPPAVTPAKIEQAILSRTFFDPAAMLLVESSQRIQGWCHYAIDPLRAETAVICAICFAPQSGSAAEDLLAATLDRIHSQNIRYIEVGLARDDRFGYAGLEPIGHGVGVPDESDRVMSLISDVGFAATRTYTQMTVATATYRPPVSREAIQLRRSTAITRELSVSADTRGASAMSHLDVELHRLTGRDGNSLAEVTLWSSDPEAEVMNANHAILDISRDHQCVDLIPTQAFLIASLLQKLASRRIFSVETVIDSDQALLYEQLISLRFDPQQHGTIWSKA